ncbi:MAG: choice-of-anchor D domain-containing protein, partial [Ignavibacteriales bacterium]|nr:choice-of-anchor D domain-containing protein [Ignavibacteriales bacterium]
MRIHERLGRSFLRYAIPLFVLWSPLLHAQQMIINELYNSSGNDEWVELLVVQDSLDIRNWDLRDYSSGGAAQSPLTFTSNSLWSLLRKGTIIVVGTSSTTFTEDTDPSDYILIIKSSNSTYFTATGTFLFAGSSDAIQIRDASDTHVFGVSWGTNNVGSLPAPKVHFSGTMSSGNTIYFNEDTTPELTSTSNWTFNTATQTPGAGNTATNLAWISALRARADGNGTATVDPDTMKHGTTSTITVTYHRDPAYTNTDMRVILPSNFGWSHDAADVSFTNMTATKSVSGDTIYFNTLTMSADSTVIAILNVTAPDSTAFYPINVQTKAQTDYADVAPLPKMVVFGLPQPISEVKGNDANGFPLRFGQLATIQGVVTVANQFGGPSYVQDNTGGMGIFGSALSGVVNIGDEVVVSGKVDPFNGLFEMTSPHVDSLLGPGTSPSPEVVTCADLKNDGAGGVEVYEGRLVRVNLVAVRDTFNNPITSWTVTGSGTNYRLIDASGNVDIRVDNNVDFANTPAPQSTFGIIGVMSQFKSTSPFIGGYQLMPRQTTDILNKGPIFATLPVESNITSSSFRISWTTVNNGTSRLRYGTTTAYELGVIEPDNTLRTSHGIDVTGLQAATIYHVQAFSVSGADSSIAGDLVVSTASPAGSTGQMNVYFNKSVNTSVSMGENALGNQDLVSLIVTRINNAHRSIDLALYSLSANGQGDVIASALISAKGRGVKVRVICEYDNSTSPGSSFPTLVSNGIPLITDRFDPVWFGAGLMHNKFFVIDYRGGAPESVWVWGGSAGAYTTEFNEMWGSDTDTPNSSTSRFGGRKTDNTPHHFIINGVPVSSYFSPSDDATRYIRETIGHAQHSVAACILTFTRKDIADSVIARKTAGDKTRVLMDNNTDSGNQYSYLQSNGVDVHLKGGSGLLHHKYVVIDGDQVAGTQYAETGSHNWSNSAENSNDENTLIVQNRRVANLYLQEFAARYYEAGGTDSLHITDSPIYSETPSTIAFDTVIIGQTKQDSFTVSNTGTLSLTISSVTASNAYYSVSPSSATVPPSATQKFYVTFIPTVLGIRYGTITVTHDAPGSPNTVSLYGIGKKVTTDTVTSHIGIMDGWNMVSVPVAVSDNRRTTLFPTATSMAFAFETGYVPHDSLVNGKGFWVKFSGAQTDSLTGIVITAETI